MPHEPRQASMARCVSIESMMFFLVKSHSVSRIRMRGSPIDVPDAKGRTPLALAVKACVDSFWTERRSPDSVQALLRAGASVGGVDFPSGYAEVDELLRRYGAGA